MNLPAQSRRVFLRSVFAGILAVPVAKAASALPDLAPALPSLVEEVVAPGSYVFRRQTGFFDVHTYVGNGTSQFIEHGLGCRPAYLIVKNRTQASEWMVFEDTEILPSPANKHGHEYISYTFGPDAKDIVKPFVDELVRSQA